MSLHLVTDEESRVVRCARHPGTETVLRCGRCDTPICPRCMVHTPVGPRCPSCAGVKRFSMFLKPQELTRAIAYGVGMGAAGPILLSLLPLLGLLGPLLSYMVIGFLVGQVVSMAVNRKRVRELSPIAVACLFAGYEIGTVITILLRFQGAIGLGPELILAPILALANVQLLIGLLAGALLAWMRVR